MKFLALLVGLFFSFSAQAETITSVFADSQFTGSQYGATLAKKCLNPSKMKGTGLVEYFALPSGSTRHILTSEQNPVPIRRMRAENASVSGFTKTGSTNGRGYFNAQLADESVSRVMIFMGVNEVNGDGQNWKEIAKQLKDAGKHCYVGLPPLTDNSELNRKIVKYNQRVQRALLGSSCRIVDTSRTLLKGIDGTKFPTSDGVHFDDSAAREVAAATCSAIGRASRFKLPKPEIEEEIAEEEVDEEYLSPAPIESSDREPYFWEVGY